MVQPALFSQEKSDWETPQWLFDKLNNEFGFTLDVCADKHNHKCDRYFSVEDDGLNQDWSGETCWMNPPYSHVSQWIEKAYNESQRGATVVALVPSRTCTKWFHNHVYGKAEIRFIKGRLKFVGAKNSAPFPSMVVVYRDAGMHGY